MSLYNIREARRKDVETIVALWLEMMVFHHEWDPRFHFTREADREYERHIVSTMRSQGARVFVGETNSSVIAFLLAEIHARPAFYPAGRYGFISDLCVTADWRRQGVGRALVEHTLEWFKRERANTIELFVAEANPVSTAFWKSMGFSDYVKMLRREI